VKAGSARWLGFAESGFSGIFSAICEFLVLENITLAFASGLEDLPFIFYSTFAELTLQQSSMSPPDTSAADLFYTTSPLSDS
jgi:hypothetical protein